MKFCRQCYAIPVIRVVTTVPGVRYDQGIVGLEWCRCSSSGGIETISFVITRYPNHLYELLLGVLFVSEGLAGGTNPEVRPMVEAQRCHSPCYCAALMNFGRNTSLFTSNCLRDLPGALSGPREQRAPQPSLGPPLV